MLKKDLGLLVLILVVGAVVAIINPRFLSPINIANTANLVGLFGIFAIGQGFVIITGGIELSVGSIIALLGVIFVDLIANKGVPWPLAALLVLAIGIADGPGPRPADHQAEAAALRRDALRPADLSRRRALLHQGRAPPAFRSASTSPTSNGSPRAAPTSSRCSPAARCTRSRSRTRSSSCW